VEVSVLTMRLVKKDDCLSITSVKFDTTNEYSKHGSNLPPSIRCIICGPSNCGKTSLLLSLLYDPLGLKFENVFVFCKSLFQTKYLHMQHVMSGIEEISLQTFDHNLQMPRPENIPANSLFVFDDIACDKQDLVRSYFSMGRHRGLDVFYLSQSYSRIPKQLIRDNANLLILFRQDVSSIKRIYEDHVNSDMSFQMFNKICAECWRGDKYGFIVIDKDKAIDNGRYRKNFNNYIIV